MITYLHQIMTFVGGIQKKSFLYLLITLIIFCSLPVVQAEDPLWEYNSKNEICGLSMSPDGSVITLCGEKIHYLLNSGTLEWKQWFGDRIDVSGNGAYVICSNGANMFLSDKNADKLWEIDGDGDIEALQIASDGSLIAAGDNFGRVLFFNKAGKRIRTDDTRGDIEDFDFRSTVNQIAMSNKGTYTAAITKRGLFYYNKKGRRIWAHEGQLEGEGGSYVAISNSGKEIAAGCDNIVKLINSSGDLVWNYDVKDVITSIAISPDGSDITAASQDSRVYFFNKTGDLLWTFDAEHWIRDLAVSTNGTRVIAGSMDKAIYLLDGDGTLLWKYKTDSWVNNVAISEDGSFAVAATSGNVYAFNTTAKSVPAILPKNTTPVPDNLTSPETPAPTESKLNVTPGPVTAMPTFNATPTEMPENNITGVHEPEPPASHNSDLSNPIGMPWLLIGGLLISAMMIGSGYYIRRKGKKQIKIPVVNDIVPVHEADNAAIPEASTDDITEAEDEEEEPDEEETQKSTTVLEEMVNAGNNDEATRYLYSEMLDALTEIKPVDNVKILTPNEILLQHSGQPYENNLREFLNLYLRLHYSSKTPSTDEVRLLNSAFSATIESVGSDESEV